MTAWQELSEVNFVGTEVHLNTRKTNTQIGYCVVYSRGYCGNYQSVKLV